MLPKGDLLTWNNKRLTESGSLVSQPWADTASILGFGPQYGVSSVSVPPRLACARLNRIRKDLRSGAYDRAARPGGNMNPMLFPKTGNHRDTVYNL